MIVDKVLRERHSRPWRLTRQRHGAVTVEVAMLLPVFLTLIFGIVECGRMVMVQQAMTYAARHGCRQAVLATSKNQADAKATTKTYLQAVMPNTAINEAVSINVTPSDLRQAKQGTMVTVDVSVGLGSVTWLPLDFLGIGEVVVLKGHASQRHE